MTLVPSPALERLVKTRDRVQDLGEVFTPAATVQAMLDLLPPAMWEPHPAPTFLEPACGDGNFLVAILDRKLRAVTTAAAAGTLPADTRVGLQLHALEALASIYGVDISPENILGRAPDHPVGARDRMLTVFADWYARTFDGGLDPQCPLALSVAWILERNIQVGNMLPTKPDGSPSGFETLPLCAFTWDPQAGTVTVATTTLGDVMEAADERVNGIATLFGVQSPTPVWTGPAHLVHQARVPSPRGRKAAR